MKQKKLYIYIYKHFAVGVYDKSINSINTKEK